MKAKTKKRLFGILLLVGFSVTALMSAACNDNENKDDTTVTPPPSATHTCEEKCPVCGGCTDYYCEYDACKVKCGDGRTEHEFLAADANAVIAGSVWTGQLSDGTRYLASFPGGASATFTITSSAATTVSLAAEVGGKTASSYRYLDDVDVTVNGTKVNANTKVPYSDYSDETEFFDVGLGCVSLKEGDNTIVVAPSAAVNNISYTFKSIKLFTDTGVTVGWSENIYAHECPVCGICRDPVCISGACDVHCMCDHQFKNTFYAAADETVVEGSNKNTGENCVGFNNNQTSTYITFNISSPVAEEGAGLYIYVTTSPAELPVTEVYTIYVNGSRYDTDAVIKEGDYWTNYHSIYLGDIDLLEGDNVIQLVTRAGVNNNDEAQKIYMHNLRSIIISSDAELSFSGTDWSSAVLTLDTSAVQKEFIVGDTFGYTGLKAMLDMGDGSAATDVSEDVAVAAPDMTTSGTKTVTVRYGQVSATYEVTVKPSPATFTINTENAPKEFTVGDKFTYEGLVAEYSATGEAADIVNVTADIRVSEPDMTTAGEKTVTVTYGIFSQTYAIVVRAAGGESAEYKFEAESPNTVLLVEGPKNINIEAVNVGNLYPNNLGAKIIYTINADKAGMATLIMSVGDKFGATLSDVMSVTVNGVLFENTAGWQGDSSLAWSHFTDVVVGDITLKQGLNVIVFEVTTNDNNIDGQTISFNFDGIKLRSESFLSWYTPAQLNVTDVASDGHSLILTVADESGAAADVAYVMVGQKYYPVTVSGEGGIYTLTVGNIGTDAGEYSIDFLNAQKGKTATAEFSYALAAPVLTASDYTGGVLTLQLTDSSGALAGAVSATVGTIAVTGDNFEISYSGTTCTAKLTADIPAGVYTITFYNDAGLLIATVEYTLSYFDEETAVEYRFEAEAEEVVRKDGKKAITVNNSYIGGLYANNLGAKVTFNIRAEKATSAMLYMFVSNRNGGALSEAMKITVNGVEVVTSAEWSGGGGWETFVQVAIGEVSLKEGVNVIEFEVIADQAACAFNFDAIMLDSNAPLTLVAEDEVASAPSSGEESVALQDE